MGQISKWKFIPLQFAVLKQISAKLERFSY